MLVVGEPHQGRDVWLNDSTAGCQQCQSDHQRYPVFDANKELAKQRVKAIEDILIAAGIDSDRLVDTKVEYVGDQKPNDARSRLATASLM